MSQPCIFPDCQATIEGHGHNARPLYDGRCCDSCNARVQSFRLWLAFGLDAGAEGVDP